MAFVRNGLRRVKNGEKIEERTKDERYSRRVKMATAVAFKLLNIVVISEANKTKPFPQVGKFRKETVGVEV